MNIIFRNEIFTLASLKKVDEHPLYIMKYEGDYGFTDFLKVGAKSDRDIEKFVVNRLLRGINIELGISSAGCSAFTSQNIYGQRIYGRNFDFDYSPALLLTTTPSDGYASISMVNLAYAGYSEDNLPHNGLSNRFLTLTAPFLPFDGMNEKGVVIALLAVPKADPPNKEGRIMLNTTTAIRLILDHAASVDEAINLLDNYNIYFSGGVECHYLISDASGDSAVIEFIEGEIKIIRSETDYQLATNFIMFQGLNVGEGGSEFERYETIKNRLETTNGEINEADAMKLLADVKISNRTQWSVIYNQTICEVSLCMSPNYSVIYKYAIKTLN
ncbi:MAG: C45 family autoproteolytic acyltransferase/hydrolase [Eubacteriales bacterium]